MSCLILSGSSYSNTVSPCAVMSKLPCTESNYLYIVLVIIVLTSGWSSKSIAFLCGFQRAQADTKQWLFVSALWLLRIPRHWADVTVLPYYKTQRKQRCPSSHLTTFKKHHRADFNLCWKLNGYICVRMPVRANLHTLSPFCMGTDLIQFWSRSCTAYEEHIISFKNKHKRTNYGFPNSLDRFQGWKPPGFGTVES